MRTFDRDFKYFLLDENNNYFYEDNLLNIHTSIDPVELNYTPDGWQDKSIKFKRDSVYFGVVRSFTLELSFVEDGKRILQSLFYSSSVNAFCRLQIQRLNRKTMIYEDYYSGIIDFSTFNDKKSEYSVSASLIEDLIPDRIKNNDTKKVEITLTDDILHDGIIISKIADINTTPTYDEYLTVTVTSGSGHFLILPFTTISQTNEMDNDLLINQTILQAFSNTDDWFNNSFIEVQEDIPSVFFNFRLKNLVFDTNISGLKFHLVHGERNLQSKHEIVSDLITTNNQPFEWQFSLSLTKGEIITVYVEIDSFILPGIGGSFEFHTTDINGSDPFLEIAFNSRKKITEYAKGINLLDLGNKLIEDISGNSNILESAALQENVGWRLLVTTAKSLRKEGNTIITTFKDYFDTISKLYGLGYGFENGRVKIEKRSFFFDKNTEILHLGNVTDLKISVHNDWMFNALQSGYPTQNDNINLGNFEWNDEYRYHIDINFINNTLDLISKYRYDIYGIEEERIKITDSDSTTTNEDDIFLVCVNENKTSGYYSIYRPQNDPNSNIDHVTGINQISLYNFMLTAKDIIINNGDFINALMWNIDSNIIFDNTDKRKNFSISYKDSSPSNTPAINISKDILPDPLFKPLLYEFTTAIPNGALQDIETNKNGFISFVYNDILYRGFLMELDIQPAKKEAQDWKLLALPD